MPLNFQHRFICHSLHTGLLWLSLHAGQLYLDREDFDEAKEYINKVLQLSPGQHDSYALLLKAVLNLKTGQFHVDKHTAKGGDARGRGDPKAAETLQKIHDCFFKALQHFSAVLRKDPHNIYAANGVAAVLAEKGNLMQAREIFISVRDVLHQLTALAALLSVTAYKAQHIER